MITRGGRGLPQPVGRATPHQKVTSLIHAISDERLNEH